MATPKVTFKNVDEVTKTKFKSSKCLLTISVGQQSHEGELFSMTMDLVDQNFASCVILVDDTLQRHTMALNSSKSIDELYDISLKEGDLWLKRNCKYYSKLTIPYKIIRWDYWLNHSEFNAKKKLIEDRLESDPGYHKSFDITHKDFLDTYVKRLEDVSKFNVEDAIMHSFNFVLEECVGSLLWVELQCDFEIYPGKHNPAILYTRSNFVTDIIKNQLNPITICYRNFGRLPSQRFVLL